MSESTFMIYLLPNKIDERKRYVRTASLGLANWYRHSYSWQSKIYDTYSLIFYQLQYYNNNVVPFEKKKNANAFLISGDITLKEKSIFNTNYRRFVLFCCRSTVMCKKLQNKVCITLREMCLLRC